MTPVTFRPRAEQDLNDIEEELAKRYSPEVATQFIQTANETWDLAVEAHGVVAIGWAPHRSINAIAARNTS